MDGNKLESSSAQNSEWHKRTTGVASIRIHCPGLPAVAIVHTNACEGGSASGFCCPTAKSVHFCMHYLRRSDESFPCKLLF
jgi:hypothetical protein